jgi:hypothetical protein
MQVKSVFRKTFKTLACMHVRYVTFLCFVNYVNIWVICDLHSVIRHFLSGLRVKIHWMYTVSAVLFKCSCSCHIQCSSWRWKLICSPRRCKNLQNMIGLISENRSCTLNSDNDNIITILFIFFNNASVFFIEEIAKAKQDDRNVPWIITDLRNVYINKQMIINYIIT